ncbi:MAG: RNA polymerase factor sigma-32 [Proteobacteria bacterium]|nr:RNA polymerase factor sigma-32 [Pseudomonadota bacterium]
MAYYEDSAIQQANTRYIHSAMHEPMLEREHELGLARRWKDRGDEKALHELIRAYRRLVISAAAKFRNYNLPMGDLIQEGNIGLMEAASRFDPALENRFSTYATWWVKAQIQDYVLRNWSIVRTGTTSSQKSLFFNLRRLRAKMASQSGRNSLDKDAAETIAQELNVTPEDVLEMEVRMGGDWSLNGAVGGTGEEEWQDILADHCPTPEEAVMRSNDNAVRFRWLNSALNALDQRERRIIEQRHLSEPAASLGALGRDLGVSQERIRQLEQRALGKLRTAVLMQSRAQEA